MTLAANPQNPYESFLVAASAGCGKTYQLSQRFLCLVAAGADPAQILTVTYTRKAVAEMRERIIKDAMKLASDADAQENFERLMSDFYEVIKEKTHHEGRDCPTPPRGARETAETILAATQSIRISTIDSIFYEWSNKFGDELLGEREFVPTPVAMTGALEKQHLSDHAEHQAYQDFMRSNADGASEEALRLDDLPGNSFDDALSQARVLDLHDTFIWTCGEDEALLLHHVDESLPVDEAACIQGLSADLKTIIGRLSNPDSRDACLAALSSGSLQGLQAAGLLTREDTVSKGKIKGKTRDALANEITRVDASLVAFRNAEKIRRLNRQGAAVFRLRQLMQEARSAYKKKHRLAEFSDLTKVVFKLFTMDQAVGTRYLIQRSVRHLLLDEFQDTSRSQWRVFRDIATEILSGEGLSDTDGSTTGSIGSVFLVGDEKQSVYGYREADPEVLEDAAADLSPLGLRFAPLNASYRSAQLVLDFVNEVFSDQQIYMNDFPHHETARQKSLPVIPNAGRLLIKPVTLPDPTRPLIPAEEIEAEQLATHLKEVLSGTHPAPVWDKLLNDKKGGFRAIKPGDCAVLYRAKTKVHLIEAALRQADIPFVREEAQGFFERPEIQDAVNLFSFLAKPSDLAALCGVLRSPFGGLTNSDLQEILIATAPMAGTPERSQAMINMLAQSASPVGKALLNALDASHKDGGATSSEIFRRFTIDTRALSNFAREFPVPDDTLAPANLTRFVEILLDLESKGCQTFALQLQAFKDLAALDETGTQPPASDAVRLMTIHKSKGLEFSFVALFGTATDWLGSERYWLRGKSAEGRPGIYYVGRAPERPLGDPGFDQIKNNLTELSIAEMRRLLYVALTRAKQYLYVSGSMKDPAGFDKTYLGLMLAASARMASHETAGLSLLPLVIHENSLGDAPTSGVKAESELDTSADILPKDFADLAAKPAIVPAEVRINSAAKLKKETTPSELERRNPVSADFDRECARIHGLMVHGVLELAATGSELWRSQDWQFRKWLELLNSLPPSHQWAASGHKKSPASKTELQAAVNEAKSVLQSAAWRQLLADAATVVAECPLAMLTGQELFSGRADLLVQKQNGDIWAIDYKTSAVESADLRTFAISQGFDQQVAGYTAALRATFPGRTVKGALLFTADSTLLTL